MKKILIALFFIITFAGIGIYLWLFPCKSSNDYYIGITQILGGLLSGGLTVLGVSWTISYQEKARFDDVLKAEKRQKEQFRLENLPVFQYTTGSENNAKDSIVIYINCDHTEPKTTDLIFNLNLKNIGLRAAQHIYFQIIIDSKTNNSKYSTKNSLIKPDDDYEIIFCFKTKFIPTEGINKDNIYYPEFMVNHDLKVIVYYDDLIGNHYLQELKGSISRSYSIVEQEDVIKVCDNVSIYKHDNYMLIDDNFEYIIPKEVTDIAEKQKKEQTRMAEFYKLKNHKEIDNLIGIYLKKHNKDFIEYAQLAYKKLKFIQGDSGMNDYKEIEKDVFLITIKSSASISESQHIIHALTLKVDLNTKTVTKISKKIVSNTLPVSKIEKWLKKNLYD